MHDEYKNPDTVSATSDEEAEIDLLELASRLWDNRRKIMRWCGIGAVIGLIIAFSIPKEYLATVKLAPEIKDGKSAGSLGALASMAGLSAGSSSSDALNPDLYPEVVNSVPFITSLFDVRVPLADDDSVTMPVIQYLQTEVSSPWWNVILGLPGKLIGLLKGSDEQSADHTLDNFRLTPQELGLVEALRGRISTTIDSKSSLVSINVTMQDPLVAAVLADTVMARLQEFVIDYRTTKARQDLKYIETLNEEAKATYYKAQQNYAAYLDRNQNLSLFSAQTTRDRLQNEAQLAFNLYNQTAQQVQTAQAKVQENTPVFAVVTPATVPVKAAKPRKAIILVGFIFLGFVLCSAWILMGEPLMEKFRKPAVKENSSAHASDDTPAA
ncbi:MAG: chain-length determining protein [Bacteroides sp.]|nr:chain-length determining protein [Bacteroides sp.]